MSVSTTSVARKKKKTAPERHVLVIDDGHRRAVSLDAAAYSVGRDPSNAIVLDTSTVSRKHAILLRLPIPGENRYRYRLIDGDSGGKPSANGVFVNQQRCSSHELVNGDTIGFGVKVQASYLTVAMEESEFAKYLESIEFHSLKSQNQVNSKATLVANVNLSPAEQSALSHNTVINQAEPDLKGTLSEEIDILQFIESSEQKPKRMSGRYRLAIILATILAIAGLGTWWSVANSQSQEQQECTLQRYLTTSRKCP